MGIYVNGQLVAGTRGHTSGSTEGDMRAATYDPQGRKTDIFKYIDDKIGTGGSGSGSADLTDVITLEGGGVAQLKGENFGEAPFTIEFDEEEDTNNGTSTGGDSSSVVEIKGYNRFVIGTSTNGATASDCDYLCDGTADDVEIQQAIDDLMKLKGGELYFLPGNYIIANDINIEGTGTEKIVLKGYSPKEVKLWNTSSSTYYGIKFSQVHFILNRLWIQDLYLQCDDEEDNTDLDLGFEMSSCIFHCSEVNRKVGNNIQIPIVIVMSNKSIIINNNIIHLYTSATTELSFRSIMLIGYLVTIVNNYFYGNLYTSCLEIDRGRCDIKYNYFSGFNECIFSYVNLFVYKNNILNCNKGITVSLGYNYPATIQENVIESYRIYGISLSGTYGTVQNNTVTNSAGIPTGSYAESVGIRVYMLQHLTVKNNLIIGSKYGIEGIMNDQYYRLHSNKIVDNIINYSNNGIYIHNVPNATRNYYCAGNIISGNIIDCSQGGTTAWSIYLDSDFTDSLVIDNICSKEISNQGVNNTLNDNKIVSVG